MQMSPTPQHPMAPIPSIPPAHLPSNAPALAHSPSPAHAPAPAEHLWQQVLARAPQAPFVYAVRTTGIFCRPNCPSRRPSRLNVEFFPDAQTATTAGFRPCLRCRPDQQPAEAALIERLVAHLARNHDRTVPPGRARTHRRPRPRHSPAPLHPGRRPKPSRLDQRPSSRNLPKPAHSLTSQPKHHRRHLRRRLLRPIPRPRSRPARHAGQTLPRSGRRRAHRLRHRRCPAAIARQRQISTDEPDAGRLHSERRVRGLSRRRRRSARSRAHPPLPPRRACPGHKPRAPGNRCPRRPQGTPPAPNRYHSTCAAPPSRPASGPHSRPSPAAPPAPMRNWPRPSALRRQFAP